MMDRPIGLAALTVLDLAPPAQVEAAAAAGYSHVGLRLIPATPQEVRHPVVGDTPMVRELAQRLSDTGVKVLDVEIFRLTPDVRIADFEPAMATAARLGAQHMLVAGNDPDPARLADSFVQLDAAARAFGLNACLEPMPWTDVATVAAAQRIVGAATGGGVLIDAIHFFRADNSLEEVADLPRRWLRYMQLCDAPAACPTDRAELIRQARGDRLFPGDGGLDLRGLLRALPPDIPVSLEIPVARRMDPLERARRALAAARQVLAEAEAAP
ncbi:TIM barrel protein [Vineibacter terrae]|uniref:TIM barrel protein n=1 Tax=Vineibacter terrae TaxID=2586908 RepID=A0A5C8PTN6_9HYPH|nr:TIM barrel protein [Vineibacter terrae]TXL80353.1 TIM barrel protein [Vineibacter terrae]